MATYTDIHNKVKESINVNYTDRVTTQQVKLHNLSNEYWGILSGTIRGDISAADIVGCRIVDSTVDGLSVATLAAEMTRYRGTLQHKETHDLSAFIWWNLRERPSSEHNLKYGDLFKLNTVGQYGLSTYHHPEIILDLGENDFFILNKTLSAIKDIQVSDLDVFRNSESEVSAIEKKVAELATKVDSLSGNVEALSTDVSTLSSNVDVISTDVRTLSSNVDVISTDVNTLSSRVDVISTDVSMLCSDLHDLSTTVDEKLFVKDYVDPELSANTYKQLSVIHVKESLFDKNVMTRKCPPNVLQIVDSGCMNAEGQVLSNLMMPEDGEDFKRISVGATKRYVDEKDVALCAAISAISSDSPMIGELSAAIKHKVYVVDPEAAEEHKAHYTDLSVIKLTQDEYDSLVAYENPILSNGNILYVISSDINDAHGKVISNLVMPLSGTEDFEGVAATDKYVLKMINDKGNLSDIMNVISAVSSDLSSAISTDVKNLADNYYKKTETYNKTEVDSSVSRMQTALNQLNATVTADVQNLATNYYKKTDVYTKGEANQISSSLSATVQTQYTKKSEVSTISATLSSKIDSVMTVDDQLQHAIGHELSVIKLPLSAYEQLAYRGKCLSNALYIVSSDVLDAQGQVISNLMMPEDGEDFERADVAVTKRYANERLSSVSGDVLSAVDAKIGTSLSGMMTDPVLSSLENLRNLEDVLSAITFIADRFGGVEHPIPPDPVDTSEFGQLAAALEDSNGGTIQWKGTELQVGGALSEVKYKLSDSVTANTDWKILGYNSSIPEYVKYRTATRGGYKHLWVKSTGDLLKVIANSNTAYTRTFDSITGTYTYTAFGTISNIAGSFTYGNNCTYSVPTSFDCEGKTYVFCGYNLTIQSDCCLNWDGSYYRTFNSYSGKYSTWSASEIRSWLNSTIKSKLNFNGLLSNISKAVNRTWVHGDNRSGLTLDSNYCTHTADSLWLLGMGNINCTGKSGSTEYFKDQYYDTSIFSDVFKHRDDVWTTEAEPRYRAKYYLTSNGTKSASALDWWLRSSDSYNYTNVGYVNGSGTVSNRDCNCSYGVAPACVIG